MVALRRIVLAGVATLLIASACTNVAAGPTIPPINIPTIPPINLPSIPPINIPGLPSGGFGGIPGLPSGGIGGLFPSGFDIPIPTGSVPCSLVTAAEVGQIMGATVTDASDSATDCTFVTSGFSTISVSVDQSTDLSGVQFLMGNSAQQTTIAGNPAITGTALGFPAVYVQKGANQLTVLGFLLNNDQTTTMNALGQIATIAVGRMP